MALKDHCKSVWSHVLLHDFCKLLIFNYHLRKIRYEILTIKNTKLSGYYFYINFNIWGDFQICISLPLKGRNFAGTKFWT